MLYFLYIAIMQIIFLDINTTVLVKHIFMKVNILRASAQKMCRNYNSYLFIQYYWCIYTHPQKNAEIIMFTYFCCFLPHFHKIIVLVLGAPEIIHWKSLIISGELETIHCRFSIQEFPSKISQKLEIPFASKFNRKWSQTKPKPEKS